MSGDAELEAIRQRRVQQLMAEQGGKLASSPEEQERQAAQQEAAEEQRRTMLAAVLEPSARERLTRIGLVRGDKARAVEDLILAAARRGQLQARVSESRLIELLEQVSGGSEGGPRVTIQRRRNILDDDF